MNLVKRGYHYRFYPTPEQAVLLAQTFGCVRKVWNEVLEWRIAEWEEKAHSIDYKKASARLTELKQNPEFFYLNDVSSVPLQQALRHQQAAFVNFYRKVKNPKFKGKKAGYPKFKSLYGHQSVSLTKNAFVWDGEQRLKLAKMREPLDIRWSREIPEFASVTSVTVSRNAAWEYYVSFQCEALVAPLPVINTEVGIDLGIKDLIALSTGEKIPNPRHLKKELGKQKYLQRSLARKQKGSNRYKKARSKYAAHQNKIRNRRKDSTHKTTTRIITENQRIKVEDLNISGMMKNRRLAKHLADANLSEIVRQLTYKAAWYGRELIVIDRWMPSSKRCSDCGYVLPELSLSIRHWTCPACASVHDRDINAAKNILAAGHAVLARGEESAGLRDVSQSKLASKTLQNNRSKETRISLL